METKKVTLIVGDGIGPEIVESVKDIFEGANVPIEFEEVQAGGFMIEKYGKPLPDHVLESVKKNKIALKAPLGTPVGEGFRSVNVELRKKLKLYSNLRPVSSIEGVKSRYEDIDLVIVRENTEDIYSGIEHYIGEDKNAAETIKIITRFATERIAHYAFDYAVKNGRKKITIVHKANIQKYTDGLFLKVCREIAEQYPTIEVEDKIVDNMTMQLVQFPERYDMLLCPNFYGDILSDLCAGLIGGLGVAPGANIGEDYAVFEAVHGTAPDIAGKGLANPTALLLSGIMMLRFMGLDHKADMIESSLRKVLKEGKTVTGDVGGTASTKEFTNEIINNLYDF